MRDKNVVVLVVIIIIIIGTTILNLLSGKNGKFGIFKD